MTNKERVIAEIERLTEVTGYALSKYENGRRSAMYDIRKQLIEYINSLHAEPSGDLDKEIRYVLNKRYGYEIKQGSDIWYTRQYQDEYARLLEIANWQKEQTIDKACEWLLENVLAELVLPIEDKELIKDFIENFKKAMEDKQ